MRGASLVLSISFSFLIVYSLSQERHPSYTELLREYSEADQLYHKALHINTSTDKGAIWENQLNQLALSKFRNLEQHLPQNSSADSLHFFLSLKTGELYHYFDSLVPAQLYYNRAIAVKQRLPFLVDSFVFKPYLFSGNIYFRQNKLDEAAVCFKKAEAIQEKYSLKLEESERLFNDLGLLYFQSGNYQQASNYFRKAGHVLAKNNPFYEDLFVNYQINYAIVLFKLEKFSEADSILHGLLPYGLHLDEIYNNIGLIQHRLKKFQEAIVSFQKVHYSNALQIGLQNDRANAWLALKNYDSVFTYLNAALQKNKKFNRKNTSVDFGLSLKIYGDMEKDQSNFTQALRHYQQALNQFYPAFTDSSIHANPKKFTGRFSYVHLFHTLEAKAAVLDALYLQTKNMYWAREELNAFGAAFLLIDYIEKTYDSDEARLFLEKSKYAIHDRPVVLAFDLYTKTKLKDFLEMAYELDQKNKATVLAFNDHRNQLNIPATGLREQEHHLKVAITRLSLQAPSSEAVLRKESERQISELEMQLGKVQEKIGQHYPVVTMKVPTISFIQNQMLDDETQLLSFHLGEKKLTVFSITKSAFRGIEKNIYPEFYKDLENFVSRLHTLSDTLSSDDEENKRLNLFLLDSVLDPSFKRLIIIPDNELNFLPFDALKQGNSFLIEKYSIQYQYSTLLLKKDNKDFSKATTVSFAPFTKEDYSGESLKFYQLPQSLQEVSGLDGTLFINEKATKQNFLDNYGRNQIIHLATHAVAYDSAGHFSFIAFAPWNDPTQDGYLLYAPEIYNLDFSKNRLVILSACETGFGKLVKGEGIMSLSRAFSYAGCPNIIASYWKADDQATAYLGQKIHVYLKKGFSVDEALQKAKKDYLLDRSINPRMKQPAYWANLVLIGNYQPHAHPFDYAWIWSIILIVAALLILIRRFIRSPA